MRRIGIICVAIIMSINLCGCWDKVEINRRSFITVVCIDKYEVDSKDKNKDSRNRYTVTVQYPNTGVVAGKGEGDSKFFYTVSGQSLTDALDLLSTRLQKKMSFRHTKEIILGEKLVSDEMLLRETLDVIERNPEIGRRIQMLITKGEAKKTSHINVKDEPIVGTFIRDIVDQRPRASRIADADIGYILRSMQESRVAVIPRMIPLKDELKMAGCGVIKNFKMIGYLGELETRNLMFLFNKLQGSIMDVQVNGLDIPIRLTGIDSKKRVVKDNGFCTTFKIAGEGNLEQHLYAVKHEPLNEEYIKKVEKIASEKLQKELLQTYRKVQKTFKADLFQCGEYLRKHDPNTWEQVKYKWQDIFPKTDVKIDVKLDIRRAGVTQ